MKYLLAIVLIIVSVHQIQAQDIPLSDPQPYFSAFIVSDIDSSIHWYSDILSFELLNKTENEERGFYQANLKRGKTLVELIQLAGTQSQTEAAPNVRLEGIFKIGYKVEDFDSWIIYLKDRKVTFRGDVVDDPVSGKRMVIIIDPDGNRIQFFEK